MHDTEPPTRRIRHFDSRNDKYVDVDWSQPTRRIAHQLGVSEPAVSCARRKFAPETVREYTSGGRPAVSRRTTVRERLDRALELLAHIEAQDLPPEIEAKVKAFFDDANVKDQTQPNDHNQHSTT